MRNSGHYLLLVLLSIVICSTGCSENDPNIPNINNILEGNFNVTYLETEPYSSVFQVYFDGRGEGTTTRIQNSEGEGFGSPNQFPYTQTSENEIQVSSDDDGLKGIISQDESLIVLNEPYAGGHPGLNVAVRRSSGMNNESFTGQYQGVGIEYYGGGNLMTYATNLDSDGQGYTAISFPQYSQDPPEVDGLNYQVSPDGAFTLVSDDLIMGFLSGNGDVLSFNHLEDDTIALNILFRVGQGMSNASLNGKYTFLWFSDAGESLFGEFDFDGQGSVTFQDKYASSGSLEQGTGPYSVTSTGRLTLGSREVGAISPNGQYGVSVSILGEKHMVMFVKK